LAKNKSESENLTALARVHSGTQAIAGGFSARAERRSGFSHQQRHTLQRYEHSASGVKTCWAEDRRALAELAHLQAHTRNALAACGWQLERRASAVRPFQTFNHSRNLHNPASRPSAGSSPQTFSIGDQ